MKTLYKITKPAMMLMISLMVLSCSQNLTYQQAVSKNQKKIDDPNRLTDANFLVDIKSFSILEAKLAELATTTGYSSKIVDLARKEMDILKNFNEDLGKLASREKIILPDNMNDQHQSIYNELVRSGREDFDKTYLKTLVDVNDQVSEQFSKMATAASDGDVRAFAAKKLDMVREREKKLDEVEDTLLNTY